MERAYWNCGREMCGPVNSSQSSPPCYRYVPVKVIVLINSLVVPHLQFCIAVWGSCNITQCKRVNTVIKFARRVADREDNSLAWHGDVSSEHKINVGT